MTMLADGSRAESLPAPGAPRVVTLACIGRGQPALMRILASSGAMVEEVADLAAMLARLRHEPRPALVVLEWSLPDMRGTEALQRLCESGGDLPLLVLGSPGGPDVAAESDARAGDESRPEMESGRRPLPQSLGSLVANAALNDSRAEPPPPLRVGEGPAAVLRLDTCRVYWNGRRVDLSVTEFRVVSRLAASPGVDFSHRDIYDVMKGEGIVSGRGEDGYRGNVRAAIKRIRRKFVRVDPGFSAIRSYHGFGYRWDEGAMLEMPGTGAEGASLTAGR